MRFISLIFLMVFAFKSKGQILFPVKDTLTNFYGYRNINTSAWDVPPQFEYAGDYKAGFAIVSKGGQYGTINKKGKVIIPIMYEILEGDRYFFFKKGDSTGILNQQGKMVL